MTEPSKNKPPIWEAFCKALGTEHREAREIRGASGLIHPVEAIGVDDKDKRLVLISSEFNPRVSALMRGDVQVTLPEMRVLVARPLAIDLAHEVRKMFFTENGTLDINKLFQLSSILQSSTREESENQITEFLGDEATALLGSVKNSSLRLSNIVLSVVDQFSTFDWRHVAAPSDGDLTQTTIDVLTQFSEMDNLAADREQGICPIPTYELTEADWDLFQQNKHIDEIRERLKALDIFQFFFPPADRLVLGLVDHGISSAENLAAGFKLAKDQGHELSQNTIVPETDSFYELMGSLRNNGYVAEGKFANELTPEGKTIRKEIKVRPSEGLITKISKIISIKIDLSLKDLLGR